MHGGRERSRPCEVLITFTIPHVPLPQFGASVQAKLWVTLPASKGANEDLGE
jgi:hypothetical protein